MTGAIVLITDVLFGTAATTIVTGLAAASAFAVLWYVLPLRRRFSLDGESHGPEAVAPEADHLVGEFVGQRHLRRLVEEHFEVAPPRCRS